MSVAAYNWHHAMLAAAFAALQCSNVVAQECSPNHLEILSADETAPIVFDVAIADTDETRARGLMHVTELAADSGMLFVYETPRTLYFWMKNTLIPLDMIFADSDGYVRHVHENAHPLDETPIFGGTSAQYVLEINGGMAAKLGISSGDLLQHGLIGKQNEFECN